MKSKLYPYFLFTPAWVEYERDKAMEKIIKGGKC